MFFNEECETPVEKAMCCIYEGVAFVTRVYKGQIVNTIDDLNPEIEWNYALEHAVWSLAQFPHELLTFTE